MVERARPRASECQGRSDDARDAAENRVGGCVRNGPVFSESHVARAVRRRVRHDPRKFIGLAGLSGARSSGIAVSLPCETVWVFGLRRLQWMRSINLFE